MIRHINLSPSEDGPNRTDGNCGPPLRIAYLTMSDASDRTAWSGSQYYMAQALERYCGEVRRIGPLQPLSVKTGKWVRRGVRLLTGRRYMHMYTTSFSRTLGEMAEKRLL